MKKTHTWITLKKNQTVTGKTVNSYLKPQQKQKENVFENTITKKIKHIKTSSAQKLNKSCFTKVSFKVGLKNRHGLRFVPGLVASLTVEQPEK